MQKAFKFCNQSASFRAHKGFTSSPSSKRRKRAPAAAFDLDEVLNKPDPFAFCIVPAVNFSKRTSSLVFGPFIETHVGAAAKVEVLAFDLEL